MDVLSFLTFCLVLCSAFCDVNLENANMMDAHQLTKRQADNNDGSDHSHHSQSSTRRSFVSPDGQPYYEYQPPVSSDGGLSSGRQATARVTVGGAAAGRQATSHVTIGGASSRRQANPRGKVRGPRYGSVNGTAGRRGRTYEYPFGREKVQHSGSQPHPHESSDTRSGSNTADWQQEAAPRQQRQNTLYGASNQRPAASFQNDSTQVSANQQPNYDAPSAEEQELRRRQDELRRRHGEDRRRNEELRRQLIEERKRQDEHRRRQYYEQQQRVNQQQQPGTDSNQNVRPNVTHTRQSFDRISSTDNVGPTDIHAQQEERRRLYYEQQQRANQPQTQNPGGSPNLRPDVTHNQYSGLSNGRDQHRNTQQRAGYSVPSGQHPDDSPFQVTVANQLPVDSTPQVGSNVEPNQQEERRRQYYESQQRTQSPDTSRQSQPLDRSFQRIAAGLQQTDSTQQLGANVEPNQQEERRRQYYENQQRTPSPDTSRQSQPLDRSFQRIAAGLQQTDSTQQLGPNVEPNQQEERRRQYYENQQRTPSPDTSRQSQPLDRSFQRIAAGLQQTDSTHQLGPNVEPNQQEERRRQYYENQQTTQSPDTSSQQQSVYNSFRRTYGRQQPAYRRSSTQQLDPRNVRNQHEERRRQYYEQQQRPQTPDPFSQQQPVYNSFSSPSGNQQPAYRTNDTHQPDHHARPSQRQGFTQFNYQQPGQVDPRFQPPQRATFPDFNSISERAGGDQGLGYPHQEQRPTFGSSFSYEQQDLDSDCPDTGIDLRINGLDCQQAVQQYGGYLCYTHEYTSRDCCNVCRPRKQPSRTGCEYGDHAELCSSIAPADCYDLRNRYSCCETCERLKRSNLPAGCEYGDMTIKCDNVRQNPGLCYIPDNQRLCCDTCSQIRNSTSTGCPWGDYNPNLCQLFDESTSSVRINCYSQQRRRLCCQSCERLREWITDDLPADCQYGDRPVIFTTSQFGRLNCSSLFSHFSVDECRTNQAVAINCCHTCYRFLNSRG